MATVPLPKDRPHNGVKTAARKEILAKLGVGQEVFDQARRRFPVQWPAYYLSLVGQDPKRDPIAKMGRPTEAELRFDAGDLADPIADRRLRPIPFLVRKYPDRVIVLATKKCHFYCRFCFRREEPVSGKGEPGSEDWARIFAYLADHPEIEEPILSGGDPLTLSNHRLFWIRDQLMAISSVKRWRIHSRAPVHYPERVTDELLEELAIGKPLTVVTHFNHAAELTGESRRIAEKLESLDIPFKNQAVLLAGVNDHAQVQRALWRGLAELGVRPHYLHHPDRVSGNAAFRVTIERGLGIYRELVRDWQGERPRYVLDLPDGRGKVPVEKLVAVGEGLYRFSHADGTLSDYHDIDEIRPRSEPRAAD